MSNQWSVSGDGTTLNSAGCADYSTWTDNTLIYLSPPRHTGYIGLGGADFGTYTYVWETPVTLKAKQFAVIAVGTGSIVGAHDDEAEAVAQAGRLAAKNDAEYLVLKPVRLLRQKPVDIEDVAL